MLSLRERKAACAICLCLRPTGVDWPNKVQAQSNQVNARFPSRKYCGVILVILCKLESTLKPASTTSTNYPQDRTNAPRLNTTGQRHLPCHGWCHVSGGPSFTYTRTKRKPSRGARNSHRSTLCPAFTSSIIRSRKAPVIRVDLVMQVRVSKLES